MVNHREKKQLLGEYFGNLFQASNGLDWSMGWIDQWAVKNQQFTMLLDVNPDLLANGK